MTVYIVMHWDYEDSYCDKVFYAEAKALAYANEKNEEHRKKRSGVSYTVEPREVV